MKLIKRGLHKLHAAFVKSNFPLKKIAGVFLRKLFVAFVRLDFSWLAAATLALLTQPLSGPRKYRVLALNKPVFSDDLSAISAASHETCFLLFPRLLLSEYVKKYVVDNFRALNDVTYHKIMDGSDEQKLVYKSIKKLFPHLQRFLKFDAIFAGNYVYVSQQEFFKVAQESNVPIVVLYKEGLGAFVNMSKEISKKLYSDKRFLGSKILFYNETIKETKVAAGIPGITESKTAVVGIPRFDKYFKSKTKDLYKKSVVLFSFEPDVKANRFVHDESKVKAYIERCESFQGLLVKFFVENTDYNLTIKTKATTESRQSMQDILKKYGIESLPENITITSEGSSYALINKAAFVASFLSTTLIEALVLNRPILCPSLKDVMGGERTDFFSDCPDAVNYTVEYDDFKNVITGKIPAKFPSEEQKRQVLEPIIGSLDGMASIRVDKEIIQVINEEAKSLEGSRS